MPLDDESCNFLANLIYKFENSQNKNQALANYKAYMEKGEKMEYYKDLITANSSGFIENNKYLLKVSTVEKLLEVILIIVSMDSLVEIESRKTFIHSEINWLNTENSDKIKLFAAYTSNKFYEHSANICLSSFLHNTVYFLNSCCDIKSYYVDCTYFNVKKMIKDEEIKIACIPYGVKETENVEHIIEGNIEYELCTPKTDRDKILDNRVILNYKDAIKRGAVMIFGAEMSGSEEIDNKLFEVFKESPDAMVWTPPYHCIEETKPVSKSYLFNPQTRLKIPIYKVLPYSDKLSNGVYKEEKIDSDNVFTLVHVKNLGRILFLICSDFFHSEIPNLIAQLRVDYVFIASCTPQTYTRFIELGYSSIKKDRRVLVQCNHCINMEFSLKEIKEKSNYTGQMTKTDIEKRYKDKYKPFNVIVKEMDGDKGCNKMLEKFMEDKHYPCSLENCLKNELCYFMLTFKTDSEKTWLNCVECIQGEKDE